MPIPRFKLWVVGDDAGARPENVLVVVEALLQLAFQQFCFMGEQFPGIEAIPVVDHGGDARCDHQADDQRHPRQADDPIAGKPTAIGAPDCGYGAVGHGQIRIRVIEADRKDISPLVLIIEAVVEWNGTNKPKRRSPAPPLAPD